MPRNWVFNEGATRVARLTLLYWYMFYWLRFYYDKALLAVILGVFDYGLITSII